MLINKFKLNKSFRKFNSPFELDFKSNLTIIVGENGSGKSTLFDLIGIKSESKDKHYKYSSDIESFKEFEISFDKKFKINNFYKLDSNFDLIKNQNLNDSPYDIETYVSGYRASNGECLLIQLAELMKLNLNNHILLLDEPERGLSLSYQKRVCFLLNNLLKKFDNLQIIVNTHSYVIIKYFKEVYDLDSKSYIDSNEILKKYLGV